MEKWRIVVRILLGGCATFSFRSVSTVRFPCLMSIGS